MTVHSIEQFHQERYAKAREALWGKPRKVNVLAAEKRAVEAMRRAERMRWERQQEEIRRRQEEVHRREQEAKDAIKGIGQFSFSFEVSAQMEVCDDQLISYSVDTLLARPTMERIARIVLKQFPNISLDRVRSGCRTREVYAARKAIVEEIHRIRPDKSSPEIGRFMNRDHTTILAILGRVKNKLKKS